MWASWARSLYLSALHLGTCAPTRVRRDLSPSRSVSRFLRSLRQIVKILTRRFLRAGSVIPVIRAIVSSMASCGRSLNALIAVFFLIVTQTPPFPPVLAVRHQDPGSVLRGGSWGLFPGVVLRLDPGSLVPGIPVDLCTPTTSDYPSKIASFRQNREKMTLPDPHFIEHMFLCQPGSGICAPCLRP